MDNKKIKCTVFDHKCKYKPYSPHSIDIMLPGPWFSDEEIERSSRELIWQLFMEQFMNGLSEKIDYYIRKQGGLCTLTSLSVDLCQ